MRVLSTLLLASSTATLVTASPINQQGKRSGAAVIPLPARSTTHHNDSERVFNAEAARREMSRVLAKYAGKSFTPVAARNATIAKRSILDGTRRNPFDVYDRRVSGKEDLTALFETNRVSYYGPLSVGTPGQLTTVMFDTSSGDLVLPLASCSMCPGPKFQPESSSTFTSSSTRFSTKYLDGSSATGTVATDTVTVAGLTVSEQGFGAVTQESGNLLHGFNAGLLGLGFPNSAQSKATPFFIYLAEKEMLASNFFSFYMARNGGSSRSELCIGCMNSAKYTGPLRYYDIDPSVTGGRQYWWNIPSDGFSYNGGRSTGSFSAVIDSGSMLIYVPTAAAAALYAEIPGAKEDPEHFGPGYYTYPCDSTLGPITLNFSGDRYEINPADFNLGPVSSGSSTCVAGIVGLHGPDRFAVIGDVFMRSWYSVFDYNNRAVGFAKAV